MSRLKSSLFLRSATASLLAISLLSACGGKERPKADLAASQVTTIGVNSYLWRASLDALSFMPLTQTDSNGGVILTDWYVNPQNPGERVKINVQTPIFEVTLKQKLNQGVEQNFSRTGPWLLDTLNC